MSIILFLIVLAVLILSHELGHFIVAKKSGVRVDEFGFGFPPKIAKFKKGETTYSLNLIPFGGFVKIHGEEGQDAGDPRSFGSKPIWTRSLIISAGVIFNVALAWVLIIAGFSLGMPVGVSSAPKGAEIKNQKVIILEVAKNSPAEQAGILAGDELAGFSRVGDASDFISQNAGKEIEIRLRRNTRHLAVKPPSGGLTAKADFSVKITPRINPPAGEGALGIAMDEIGTVKLPIHRAVIEGTKMTYNVVVGTAVSLFYFVVGAIKGDVGLGAIAGPVGIAGIAGSAAKFGFVYFLSFIAFLSINLAIINILPFPALDGGRLLFLLIEKIKGSPVSPKISSVVHGAGMAILLTLMLMVTYRDILKLF